MNKSERTGIIKRVIEYICNLYGDKYDGRIEDSRPPAVGEELCNSGDKWIPGTGANHKSLAAFHRELEDMGIKLSASKIRKILINAGCWITERSREIVEMFKNYTTLISDGGRGWDFKVGWN